MRSSHALHQVCSVASSANTLVFVACCCLFVVVVVVGGGGGISDSNFFCDFTFHDVCQCLQR